MLKITAKSVFDELTRRGVKVDVLDEGIGLLSFVHGGERHFIRSSNFETASLVGGMIADRKHLVEPSLQGIDVIFPASKVVRTFDDALSMLQEHGTVVVKPTDSAHGNGVTTDIQDSDSLQTAFTLAQGFDTNDAVLVQEQVSGDDMRVLIIGGVFAAAALRKPAAVIGDGTRSVRELIEHENASNSSRGENYQTKLNIIDIEAAERYLGDEIDTWVPKVDEFVRVVGPANIGAGGISVDVTDQLPASIVEKVEQIAHRLSLTTCGIDFMVSDIDDEANYRFIEVNACPSFGMHLMPAKGSPQPVAKKFVDYIMETV